MMGGPKRFRLYATHVLMGVVGGFLIFHPYTMIVHAVTGRLHGSFSADSLLTAAKESLSPEMWPMAAAFTFSCACIGFLTAAVSERKRRLFEVELENERRRTALATLQRLMITLSHYLLNANAVIGGMARRGKKHTAEVKAGESFEVILRETARIDEVIAALKKLTELKTTDYTSEGRDLMIDIAGELQRARELQKNEGGLREG